MMPMPPRFAGVELYFENLERAKQFYVETLGLGVSDEQPGHHEKFNSGGGFVALTRKGLSRTRREIRRFSSSKCRISSRQ
jgi:catechol-2,3-dioxygenase